MDIRHIVKANPGIAEVLSKLQDGGHHLVSGVSGSQRSLLVDLLVSAVQAPVLFITSGLKDAETLVSDYEFFSGEKGYIFPAKPTLGTEVDAESHELENQRAEALAQVASGVPCVVAAP